MKRVFGFLILNLAVSALVVVPTANQAHGAPEQAATPDPIAYTWAPSQHHSVFPFRIAGRSDRDGYIQSLEKRVDVVSDWAQKTAAGGEDPVQMAAHEAGIPDHQLQRLLTQADRALKALDAMRWNQWESARLHAVEAIKELESDYRSIQQEFAG